MSVEIFESSSGYPEPRPEKRRRFAPFAGRNPSDRHRASRQPAAGNPAVEPGPCAFGDYLRSLAPGASPADDECFAAFFTALRRLVRGQLVRRGLWLGPPRFVGVAGDDRWTAEALDELTSDALIHLLERIRTLHRHLQIKTNVDGLVRLEVGHFLHERQRRADPLGHRLYSVVHEAVLQAVEDGRLTVIDGEARIANHTLLAVSALVVAPSPIETVVPRLDRAARRLVDELMPELVTGWGKRRARVVRDLAIRFDHLVAEGVGECRFKALLDAIKRAVRWRWADLMARETAPDDSHDEWADRALSVGSATPDQPFEARESLEAWVACVTRGVERTEDLGRRSHEHFANLWHFLRLRVLDESDDSFRAVPSRRQIAETLGIPRSTLGGLFERLGRLVDACRGIRPPTSKDED